VDDDPERAAYAKAMAANQNKLNGVDGRQIAPVLAPREDGMIEERPYEDEKLNWQQKSTIK
jgi:hypothetical protein